MTYLEQRAEKFWARVEKTDSCWLYKGSRCRLGYGHSSLMIGGREVKKLAHHMAMFFATGVWPKYLMHLCDTPSCVNPLHLREATPAENIRDASAKGRLKGIHTKQFCKRGHELTPANRVPNKTRGCRLCRNIKTQEWRRSQRSLGYTF